MIFVGDIAVPSGLMPQIERIDIFNGKKVIANLEGLIATDDQASVDKNVLFSNETVIELLKCMNVCAVSLANNHITDVPKAWDNTKRLLKKNGIQYFGAGKSISEASKPVIIDDGQDSYVLLSFGWDVISCKYVKNGHLGVNPLESKHVIESIREAKYAYPLKKIIAIMHWDYELEKYPMPAHRLLAKKMIDEGAYCIIGHHPHCVQGIELYKEHPIVYSLGNWFIPDKTFMNGRTTFPDYCRHEMAVEYQNGKLLIHHFEYQADNNSLAYIETEKYERSKWISELTPYKDMNESEYYKWFRTNRVKRKLLPIFKEESETVDSRLKRGYVILRQRIINTLFKYRLMERTSLKNE